MANDVSGVNLEGAVPCIKITNNSSYAVSVYGGRIKIFNLGNISVMSTFIELPPAPTEIAFHPRDNNIIVIGMHDYSIQIFHIRVAEVSDILKFHKKQITGLVFSLHLGIIVSADAEGHICVWTLDEWKKKSIALPKGATRMEFHHNQVQLLVFQKTQLAVYDAVKMIRLQQWLPQGTLSAPIRHATYSFRSKLVYTAFLDGNIGVFEASSLTLRCRIAPSVYLPEADLRRSGELHLLALAANPLVLNQFAIGLYDGTVKVIEASDGGWGSTPRDDEATSSAAVNNSLSKQVQG